MLSSDLVNNRFIIYGIKISNLSIKGNSLLLLVVSITTVTIMHHHLYHHNYCLMLKFNSSI